MDEVPDSPLGEEVKGVYSALWVTLKQALNKSRTLEGKLPERVQKRLESAREAAASYADPEQHEVVAEVIRNVMKTAYALSHLKKTLPLGGQQRADAKKKIHALLEEFKQKLRE